MPEIRSTGQEIQSEILEGPAATTGDTK